MAPRALEVVRIPIEQITVVNPRSRGQHKFRQIVSNISALGLKKPITVVRRPDREGRPHYELVCGQGRLEACRQLGEASVPALVVDVSREEMLLMSLAENLARRRHTSVAMLREIGTLKERGYTHAQIARKTDLNESYVAGIIRLLKQGEDRLLREVEKRRIPISIAVVIATSNDKQVQRALADAYESNTLRGKELIRARRLVEQRRSPGKATKRADGRAAREEVTANALVQTYKREVAKQRVIAHKARVCETRLLFVASALRRLFQDPGFVALVRASGLDQVPQSLADQVGREEVPRG